MALRIIDYAVASTALIVSLDDVRPVRGLDIPQLILILGAKYEFSVRPNLIPPLRVHAPKADPSAFAMTQGPWIFESGSLSINDTVIKIPRLEVAPDFSMVVIQTSKTEEGDDILADMALHLEKELGFRDIMKTSQRRYGSNIVFEFENGIESAVRVITDMEKIIAPLLRSTTGIRIDAKWDRISFSIDPLDIPASKAYQPMIFLIERRVGKPFDDHRWFSSAPLRTQQHVDALTQIETTFKQQKL